MPAASDRSGAGDRRVWRIAPWQPAALIALAAVLLALVIYTERSGGAITLCLVVAAAALAGAVVALRVALVADEDGVGVRSLFGQQFADWREIADIEVVSKNLNAVTIRIARRDGTFFEVPTALLQPTVPTSVKRTTALVGEVARELLASARAHRA